MTAYNVVLIPRIVTCWTVSAVVGVSRTEWDTFLSEFAALAQKYEFILAQLDLFRVRLEGLKERTDQQMAKSGEALRQVKMSLDRLCEETEGVLLETE